MTNKETKKKGYSNSSEEKVISRLLQMMEVATFGSSPKPYTIAVITPYNMQKNAINSRDIRAPAGCQFGSAQSLHPGKYKAYSFDSF